MALAIRICEMKLWPMWVGSTNLKLMIAPIYRTSLNSTTKSSHLRTWIWLFFWESVKKKHWNDDSGVANRGEWIEPRFGLKWLRGSVHKGWQLTCTTRELQIQTHEKLTERHVDLLWEEQLRLREVQEGFPSIIHELSWVSTSTEEGSTWNMIFIWGKQPGSYSGVWEKAN